ncbi:hypothetical protein BYT27DRAFT_7300755 [Phlegmacium glaucopus]|nr:hypothetical protein BYT27DRAFT_7300755 [Phlegmacium glaucopus]
MAPKTRGGSSQGHHGQPSTQHQQLQPATEPDTSAQAAVPTPPDPVTPICRTALFHVPPYNPRPIPARPSSPDEEEFDFDEADAIPITAPPAAGALGSPVKCARAVGKNQESLHRKGDLEVWDESDEDIINAARKIWRSNVYDHYITTVNRICDPFSHQPLKIEFVFTYGTTKFLKDVRMCEEKQGIYQ